MSKVKFVVINRDSDETDEFDTKEEAIDHISGVIQDNGLFSGDDFTIYEVGRTFVYVPPKDKGSLIEVK